MSHSCPKCKAGPSYIKPLYAAGGGTRYICRSCNATWPDPSSKPARGIGSTNPSVQREQSYYDDESASVNLILGVAGAGFLVSLVLMALGIPDGGIKFICLLAGIGGLLVWINWVTSLKKEGLLREALVTVIVAVVIVLMYLGNGLSLFLPI